MATYLDHAATTPLSDVAREAMLPWLQSNRVGNPSGMHMAARAARKAIDDARQIVAECVGARSAEVIFTSGGTEADNVAVMGANGESVACTTTEHHAVLDAIRARNGELLPVDREGVVDTHAIEDLLDERCTLVSVALVNNETGVIQPLQKVHRALRRTSPVAKLHTDAVQAAAWLDLSRYAQFADAISLSAHKLGGPQGVGALVVREREHEGLWLCSRSYGGKQERALRAGTQNVAGIVGFSAALQATVDALSRKWQHAQQLREQFLSALFSNVDNAQLATTAECVPGIINVLFEGVENETLLILLDQRGVCASGGSSCASGAMEPSHVLRAMAFDAAQARSALRISIGLHTTADELLHAAHTIAVCVTQLRSVT